MTGYVLAFSYQGKIEDIIVRGYCRKTHRGASGRERMCEGICQTSGTEVVFHSVCLKQACHGRNDAKSMDHLMPRRACVCAQKFVIL